MTVRRSAIRNAGKAIIFVMILLVLLCAASYILSRPHGINWGAEAGMDLVHQFRDQYDVCFAGTSTVIANISNQELYEKYGITAVSVGEPEQPMFLTKYTVEEVLRCQNPKAIIVDTRNLFYTQERIENKINENEEYFLHYSLDTIDSPVIKKKALEQIKTQFKEVDEKEYFLKLYNSHEQWKELGEEYFRKMGSASCINGNLMLTGLYSTEDAAREELSISEENERELLQIKEACENRGIDLILMTAYIDPVQTNRDQVKKLAEENQIPYLDLNEVLEKLDFQGNLQVDPVHFNVVGAALWTGYIGEYLSSRYSFETHSDRINQFIRKQSGRYSEYKNCVTNKIRLSERYRFKDFLKQIGSSDIYDISVFVAVCDDAYRQLDDEGKRLLQQIGLDGPQCSWGSFAGACLPDKVNQERDREKKVSLSGESGALRYSVESAGYYCEGGPCASIMINGEEYAKSQRGFNIVVFDYKLGELITAKCFDTFVEADPDES